MIARYVDKDTIYRGVYQRGGLVYPYGRLLLPAALSSLAEEAKEILGYPILAIDILPDYMVQWMSKLHFGFLRRKTGV